MTSPKGFSSDGAMGGGDGSGKRPTRYDAAVLRAAAEAMAPDVMEWLEESGEPDDQLISALAKALDRTFDGYERAKFLERELLLDPDARLVEILDSDGVWGIERKAVAAWVVATGAKASLPDGAIVTYRDRGEDITAEVMGRDEDQATYVLWNAKFHAARGSGGWIIAAERCQPLPPPPTQDGDR